MILCSNPMDESPCCSADLCRFLLTFTVFLRVIRRSSVARRLHEVHLGQLGQRRHFVGIADSADARQLNDSYKSSALIITQYYPILPNDPILV